MLTAHSPAGLQPLSSAPARQVHDIRDLLDLCIPALRSMYLPTPGTFAFRLRKTAASLRVEGTSDRYTAIVLIGLSRCNPNSAGYVLGGEPVQQTIARLKQNVVRPDNLGNTGLSIWASLSHGDDDVGALIDRLQTLYETRSTHATVELAWSLAALSQPGVPAMGIRLRDRLAGSLLGACQDASGLWPHTIGPAAPRLRAHIGCFADQVYPIQALALYSAASNRDDARSAARRCARNLCSAQGEAGQWWWHYDIRSGGVVEEYPVYAVHQHAMGPMALLDLRKAGGDDHSDAIERGLAWLRVAPELRGNSLIDRAAGLIWRKVGRREPNKLVRRLQAAASSIHPTLRVPATHALFPPRAIDFETRPYEYGWMLYTWGEA